MVERVRIILGGAGGQGVLTLGKMISYASIYKGLQVSCLATYGAEMRGGYVYCMIVISPSKTSFSPVSAEGDIGVFLDKKSYNHLGAYLATGARALLNSSLIGEVAEDGLEIFRIPASEKGEELGDIRAANMIAAGALGYIIDKNFYRFKKPALYYGLENVLKNKEMSVMGKKAVDIGWEFIKEEENEQKRDRKSKRL